ncbi:MAG: phenylalanine--tRNA ligase subunit alpha [Candidatus Acetothermia bacterium]
MVELTSMLEQIGRLCEKYERDIEKVESLEDCEEVRIKYLGRKGEISKLFSRLGDLPDSDKAEAGKAINEFKSRVEEELQEKRARLEEEAERHRLQQESLDMTLPGRRRRLGKKHVINQVSAEIETIFQRMGFSRALGPEIETDYHNFEALNMPKLHPARDEWDSFYLEEGTLLRTHTSPVQIRVMEENEPPVKIICPGKCFRRDTPDATHYPVFHQIEMLWVDTNLTLANLKYVIKLFIDEYFGSQFEMRFAADYFPFTEPSAQVHIRSPQNERWLEIMGAGMVDPYVLNAVGYDPDQHQGFAFGLGVERIAMLKYDIDDIRHFYRNDIRFLKQF